MAIATNLTKFFPTLNLVRFADNLNYLAAVKCVFSLDTHGINGGYFFNWVFSAVHIPGVKFIRCCCSSVATKRGMSPLSR